MIREANKNDLDEILQLYYKRATMEDIDELVRTRIIVLRAANKLSDDEDMSVVEEKYHSARSTINIKVFVLYTDRNRR